MVRAILIGFKYTKEYNELPGIVVDLYRIYNLLKKSNMNITIITDIEQDEEVQFLKDAVYKGKVKSNILSFIEHIKINNEYIRYINEHQFVKVCTQLFYEQKDVILYYTGHGENNTILLPKNSSIQMTDILQTIILNTKENATILSICDCCNGNSMGIPFKLNMTNGILTYSLSENNNRIYTKQQIIHITSSSINEAAVTSLYGSFFTNELVDILEHKNRNIGECVKTLSRNLIGESKQNICVYLSHTNILLFPRWLYGEMDACINIEMDTIKKLIKIQKRNVQNKNKQLNVSKIDFL